MNNLKRKESVMRIEIDYEKVPEAINQLNKNLNEALIKVVLMGVVVFGLIFLWDKFIQ
jgi:hypothetical protein